MLRMIVKRKNNDIEAGIVLDSVSIDENPDSMFKQLTVWENKYKTFITNCMNITKQISRVPDDLILRWKLADMIKIYMEELERNNIKIVDFEKSIARDLDLKPTLKNGPPEADVKAMLGLRKLFSDINSIDSRLSWNLFYFVYDILLSGMDSNTNMSIDDLTEDLLIIANRQAKLGIKGNGAARWVAKNLIQLIVRYNLFNR